jgi:hypothetical protein
MRGNALKPCQRISQSADKRKGGETIQGQKCEIQGEWLMVVKSEANCPKCFSATDYIYPLLYDKQTGVFTCTKLPTHQFVEDEQGFLVSRK